MLTHHNGGVLQTQQEALLGTSLVCLQSVAGADPESCPAGECRHRWTEGGSSQRAEVPRQHPEGRSVSASTESRKYVINWLFKISK